MPAPPPPPHITTPPAGGTQEELRHDNGYLSASEITELRLDADWVILSACNTAGGEAGGDALSGLARAFFYAGARALLVSHWAVDSNAATRLTTSTFDLLKANPNILECLYTPLVEHATPLAQELSIASNAAMPPKLAP